jgi:hypothetical protein
VLKKIGTIFCWQSMCFKEQDTEKNCIIWKKEKYEKIVIKKENTTNPNVK